MNSFERQIEEEANDRIKEACAIEREITARRCAEIADEFRFAGQPIRAIGKAIRREFRLSGTVATQNVIIVSDTVKPPPDHFYGDSYIRGLDPWHVDAAPDEVKDNPLWDRGERKGGWFMLDAYGNEIGWIPDGAIYQSKSDQEEK